MRRFILSIATVLAVAAALGAVAPLLIESSRSSVSDEFAKVDEDQDRLMDTVRARNGGNSVDQPSGLVVIAITSVNPSQKTIQVDISVSLPDQRSRFDFVDSERTPILDPKNNIKPQFKEKKAALYMDFGAFDTTSLPPIEFTLGDLVSYGRTYKAGLFRIRFPTIAISVPVDANPQAFPNDWYSARFARPELQLPDGVLAVPRPMEEGRVSEFGQIALVPGVVGSEQLTQWNVSYERQLLTDQALIDAQISDISTETELKVSRPVMSLLFYYSVGLAPALLGLTFLWLRWRDRGNRGADQTSAMELGAALLALLAIRQVLVPSDIQGLTVLDRMLGLELVLIVSCMVALFAGPAEERSRSGNGPWVQLFPQGGGARPRRGTSRK